MTLPTKPDPNDQADLIGELDAKVVADIIAAHYPQKSPQEILELVLSIVEEMKMNKQRGD